MNTDGPRAYHWDIEYRNIAGSPRTARVYEEKLMDALAVFNTQESTSGFDTPLRCTAYYLGLKREDCYGTIYAFTLDGRYAVPHRV
ncbi:MAG: hypothetical protein GY918_10000 [Gammaproteobacteria bacterium]|nr:hypothetical protein [Gammaproteobacteria bacterium]